MEKNLPKPAFMKPEIDLTGFPDKEDPNRIPEFSAGSFVVVADLTNLSPITREMIPIGHVAKKYNLDEFGSGWKYLFKFDPKLDNDMAGNEAAAFVCTSLEQIEKQHGRISAKEIMQSFTESQKKRYSLDENLIEEVRANYSLVKKALELKKRFTAIQDLFSSSLPNLIVKTEFIVGAENNQLSPEKDGAKYLYEVQPKIETPNLYSQLDSHMAKIEEHVSKMPVSIQLSLIKRGQALPLPGVVKLLATEAGEEIKKLLPQQKDQIKNELLELVRVARTAPDKLKLIPFDAVWPTNVRFTKDGIRVIDVNYSVKITEPHDIAERGYAETQLVRYFTLLEVWQAVAESI